ncbi:deoxyribodipyrimidine photo-lyase [Dictyobacter alpinus]|uniref:Deoxyribodipyrimidine photo-lyase n=1 Tax=Dictyobacter alpinus TaxID=2014873 RepID=A0A402B7C5_9CHLR|nr:deoxyribodipyrimidine photo-lyase [Dictyobacter alpinus]GCE27255.1 deoxyribodipyrimidine photo-lyase [Dictyobacter alpinus]
MLDIKTFVQGLDNRQRIQVWRPGTCAEDARCVIYWMQRAQRGRENHALNTAIILGNALNLPVVTAFVVTDYPQANLRHYTFMLEGLAVTAQHVKERGTPLAMRQGEPASEIKQLAQNLQAAAVVSDMCELRAPRQWRKDLQQQLEIPFICVDSDTVVPMWCIPQQEYAARTIRPKIQRLQPVFLQPQLDIKSKYPLTEPPCDPGESENPLNYLHSLQIDRSVKAPDHIHGGYSEGQKNVQRLLKERLHAYADQRNNPELVGTSELSAYLHFGQISAQQLAWDVEQYTPEETGSAHIDITGGKAAYLEELIIRRELAINFAYYNPHYDSLAGAPEWGRKTLNKHANDPREWIYSQEEFEQARTHDELWNAAQREMVVTGRMHGYMRMYWAKKILEWSETPEQAFNISVYLNDKYELDGRDANGYVGISWAIGGLHDRPWRERPIFGLIRYMGASGMKRKMDTQYYISKYGQHPLIKVR